MMMRCRSSALACSCALLFLVATAAGANPRAPVTVLEPEPQTPEEEEDRRVRKLEDVDNWLRKLVGRYRIDALVESLLFPGSPDGYSGMADCIGVGNGAGVQCLVAIHGADVLHLLMFGRNPDDLKVHVLEVDEKGIGEARSGPLRGSTMQSRAKVPNSPAAHPRLEVVKRIYISPDGEDIRFTTERELDYTPLDKRTMHFRRVVETPARNRR
jgi:hypothetical protein